MRAGVLAANAPGNPCRAQAGIKALLMYATLAASQLSLPGPDEHSVYTLCWKIVTASCWVYSSSGADVSNNREPTCHDSVYVVGLSEKRARLNHLRNVNT